MAKKQLQMNSHMRDQLLNNNNEFHPFDALEDEQLNHIVGGCHPGGMGPGGYPPTAFKEW